MLHVSAWTASDSIMMDGNATGWRGEIRQASQL
jgi:hypothetical protein